MNIAAPTAEQESKWHTNFMYAKQHNHNISPGLAISTGLLLVLTIFNIYHLCMKAV